MKEAKQEEIVLLEKVKKVVDTISKVKSNPKDACHKRGSIDVYFPLNKEEVNQLNDILLSVKEGDYLRDDKGKKIPNLLPLGGIYHIVTWEQEKE